MNYHNKYSALMQSDISKCMQIIASVGILNKSILLTLDAEIIQNMGHVPGIKDRLSEVMMIMCAAGNMGLITVHNLCT
jgi:hypothetical protein